MKRANICCHWLRLIADEVWVSCKNLDLTGFTKSIEVLESLLSFQMRIMVLSREAVINIWVSSCLISPPMVSSHRPIFRVMVGLTCVRILDDILSLRCPWRLYGWSPQTICFRSVSESVLGNRYLVGFINLYFIWSFLIKVSLSLKLKVSISNDWSVLGLEVLDLDLYIQLQFQLQSSGRGG